MIAFDEFGLRKNVSLSVSMKIGVMEIWSPPVIYICVVA